MVSLRPISEMVLRVAHRLDFLVRTSDGKLRSKRWDGSAWLPAANGTGWDDLGGSLVFAATAVRSAPDRISLLGLSSSGSLQHRAWDGGQWLPWSDLGGSL